MTKEEFLKLTPGKWLTVESDYSEGLSVMRYLLMFSKFIQDEDENVETGEKIQFTFPYFALLFDLSGENSVVTLEGNGYSPGSLELMDYESLFIKCLRESTDDEIRVAEEIMSKNNITTEIYVTIYERTWNALRNLL
jgi:hypothetical protein